MDELKKYLQTKRDQLGSEEPTARVWKGIQEAVETPTPVIKMNRFAQFSIAASVILLVGIGIWQVYRPANTSTQLVKQVPVNEKKETITIEPSIIDTIAKTITAALTTPNNKHTEQRRTFPSATPITTIHTVNELSMADEAKMESMESSFTQVINLQKARISSTPLYAESPNYFKDFSIQMKQMEKDESQIKIDIRKNGMSDELLDQLINVYQQKLNLLKLLQTEMQKLNTRYKQNRVAVDTVKTYYLHL